MSLKQIFETHTGRLLHKWEHYFDIYERYFSPYRGRQLNLLEIGISHGGSLQMWREYFGKEANIFAIDINPECKKFEDEKTKIFIGSQDDIPFLEKISILMPAIDILIDDGGHTMNQQITSFQNLFSIVKEGGIYLVEDTHTSYWKEYHGGYRKKGSFIEYSKDLVDQMHSWHAADRNHPEVNYYTKNINSISFFDSIVVFEKRKREEPRHSMKGEPSIIDQETPGLKKTSFLDRIRFKLQGSKEHSFSRQFRK